ncbi:hypothetical protein ACFQY7_51630 [Actinomadura luteofluorescens]|uniref:hypothetical protein n=1 Tax=Actinomadura luteofluorescens TaxID=46163 RepID=UPI003642DF35
MTPDGKVGPIGGIQQKMIAARRARHRLPHPQGQLRRRRRLPPRRPPPRPRRHPPRRRPIPQRPHKRQRHRPRLHPLTPPVRTTPSDAIDLRHHRGVEQFGSSLGS